MKLSIATFSLIGALFLASCQKQAEISPEFTPRATILLRDGTHVNGTVLSTNAKEITIRDANSTRTIDMGNVKSVVYGDPAPASPEAKRTAAPDYDDPAHDLHSHPKESVINTKTYGLPVGTQIAVRTEETIDSAKAVEGQIFAAEIARNVVDAAGDIVIPKGANAQIVIRSATKGGKIKGSSDLLIDLKTVSIDGRLYQIETANIYEKGRSGVGMNKRTAEYTGIGAGIGAIIGAIAGHGKGAAIGAGSGAGAGALTQIITRGPSIKIPVESVLTFRLDHEFRFAPYR
jgi:hypothetical protein